MSVGIENATAKNIAGLSDVDLRILRNRFSQQWMKHFSGNNVQMVRTLKRGRVIQGYIVLRSEMRKRDMPMTKIDLDTVAMRKGLYGINVGQLPDVVLCQKAVNLVGDFVRSPKAAHAVDVHINLDQRAILDSISGLLSKSLESIDKDKNYQVSSSLPEDTYIPIYDLALVPRSFTERCYPTESKKEIAIEPVFSKTVSPIFISKADEQIISGIVYEPDEFDVQGDKASAEEIRKAAYNFMEHSQRFGHNHNGDTITWAFAENPNCQVLESFIAPVDYEIECADGRVESVKKGSWVLVSRVKSADLWDRVKKGEITGYSMSGRAMAIDIT